MRPITLLPVDGHAVVREGLLLLIQLQRDIEVMCKPETHRQALSQARKPRSVAVDVRLDIL